MRNDLACAVIIVSYLLAFGRFLFFRLLLLVRGAHGKEKVSDKYLQWFFPLHSGLSPPVFASIC